MAPARQTPPEARTPGGHPMTKQVCGAHSRRPVHSGTHRIRGLWERERADGTTVFEFAGRLGGSFHRHTLQASTKTDAIRELEALHVDYQRGEPHRSPAAGLRSRRSRRLAPAPAGPDRPPRPATPLLGPHLRPLPAAARDYIVPPLGHLPIADVTVADVRRLLDTLGSPTRAAPARARHRHRRQDGSSPALCRFGVKATDWPNATPSATSTATTGPVRPPDRAALPDR